ncbi:Ino eighty subunit 1 [Hypsizygus marmoreus]|uniref:Ino eighty subunit 1 n=1 Tax=Hypsizygus marmoreus TaxID=39966 RepID=A0A369K6G9_HYPMA|nr:Ino eighty subunit 1 [Hypsizygus marmoreus]
MSSRRPSPAAPQRRTIALKRADGEPLTRADIQYDVLDNIFHDTHNVFTDPYPSTSDTPAAKICFRDLYFTTIKHSPKATKALKDKMADLPKFADDFSMLALLVNVGRVNTTMSFFPEMKTAIRTYHPIPALQRTNGNLQDAPRIKHILKSSILDGEQSNTPSTPADILSRARAGHIPSTTVTNLIFVLANHSASIGHSHFLDTIDFMDIFLRDKVSSASRARAFLWLCYHYLEAPAVDNDDDYDDEIPSNPFADSRRGNTPTFIFLSEAEVAQENVDPEGEKVLAEKLVAQRADILRSHGARNSSSKAAHGKPSDSIVGDDEEEPSPNIEVKQKGKRSAKPKALATPASGKGKKAVSAALRRLRLKEEKAREREETASAPAPESDDGYDSPAPTSAGFTQHNQYPQNQYRYQPQSQHEPQPLHRRMSTPELSSVHRNRHHYQYSPYLRSPPHFSKSQYMSHRQMSVPRRSMLQQAWHVITTTDPVFDSDEEIGDEDVRHDYIRRLRVINSLRHKEPTPEPDQHYV